MSKLNKKDFMFTDRDGEELIKLPGQINGNSFACRKLVDCDVYLCDYNSTIYIDNCSNTRFFFGPTEASVFMRNCHNCTLTAAGEQIRVSDSTDIDVNVFSLTDLALENAKNIRLAPYNFAYTGIQEHFYKLGFSSATNNGFYVHDFTPGPGHYSVMPNEEFKGKIVKQLDEMEDKPECPVSWPIYFGGDADIDVFATREIKDSVVNPDGSISFQMNVSHEEAEMKIQEQSSIHTVTMPMAEYTYSEESTLKEVLNAVNKGTDLKAQPTKPIEVEVQPSQFAKKKDEVKQIDVLEEIEDVGSDLESSLKIRNDKLLAALEQKHKNELRLKEERKMRAKVELENFVANYRNEIANLRTKNTGVKENKSGQAKHVS